MGSSNLKPIYIDYNNYEQKNWIEMKGYKPDRRNRWDGYGYYIMAFMKPKTPKEIEIGENKVEIKGVIGCSFVETHIYGSGPGCSGGLMWRKRSTPGAYAWNLCAVVFEEKFQKLGITEEKQKVYFSENHTDREKKGYTRPLLVMKQDKIYLEENRYGVAMMRDFVNIWNEKQK